MAGNVVLIEPEAFMQQALSTRLKLLEIETRICDSLTEALPYLEHQEHGLIVTRMAHHGLELLWWLRRHGRGTPLLLLTDEPDAELAQTLHPYGCLLGRPHPSQLAEVFGRLEKCQFQLRMEFEAITLFDLVQLLAQAQSTTHLYITDVQTSAEGLLYLQQGRIFHAVYEDLTGEAAFFKIMNLSQGMFMEMDFGSLEYYTIEADTSQLMALSALQQDEALLEAIPLAVLDEDDALCDQLQKHFPPKRLALSRFSAASATEALTTQTPCLLVVNTAALGADPATALAMIQAIYTGGILLVGDQLTPSIAEVLGRAGIEHFFLRQAQLEEMLACIQHRCFSQRFSGQLQRLSLFDSLQILGMSPVPVKMRCSDALSGIEGEIYLGNGRIWSARFGETLGREALRLCLRLNTGMIHVEEARRPDQYNLDEPLARVLMHLAMQANDLPDRLSLSDGRELVPGQILQAAGPHS